MARDSLYFGDNLDVLRRHVKDATVDLVYLDPPFKSEKNYNVLFEERSGTRSKAQIKAFEDTWHWNLAAAEAYQCAVESGGQVSRVMQALHTFLGESDMMAYLAMMAPRLVELHRVLKETGSIYLHCDPTASHYLKLLMDAVFSPGAFQNEVVWYYRGGGVSKKRYGRRHDILFFYAKGRKWTFNADAVRMPYSKDTMERLKYKARSFRGDKIYDGYEPNPLGKHPDDVWQMQPVMPSAKERLGYPTQKPEALLERIIKASTNEGDVVLDPFCGCGTAVVVAQRLKRRWIGIDVTHLAVMLIKHRLQDVAGDFERYGDAPELDYEVVGEPTTPEGARVLAADDPYQFQWWALGLVGARPAEQRKGADRGIDGRLYFHDEGPSGRTKQVIFSVKAGKATVAHVRDLRGVIERESAEIGAFLTLKEPSKAMVKEAASAGFYDSVSLKTRHPRIQILTVAELLRGKSLDLPRLGQLAKMFKRAPKKRARGPETIDLPLDDGE